MLPAAGASMMGSSPSFQASANSSASAKSGDVTSSFMSGDFVVGGNKDMIWIFVAAAVVALAFIVFKGRK